MLLEGKKGLVLNVTNDKSIGWAIADLANQHGAEVGVGGQNERMLQRVDSLIEGRAKMRSFTAEFTDDAQLENLFNEVEKAYGKIDFLVHSAAFANKEDLSGRFIETS